MEYEYSPEYTPEGYLLRFFIPFFLSSVIAIGGGVNTTQEGKKWSLVWAGAIAASFPLLISWSFLSETFALVFGNRVLFCAMGNGTTMVASIASISWHLSVVTFGGKGTSKQPTVL